VCRWLPPVNPPTHGHLRTSTWVVKPGRLRGGPGGPDGCLPTVQTSASAIQLTHHFGLSFITSSIDGGAAPGDGAQLRRPPGRYVGRNRGTALTDDPWKAINGAAARRGSTLRSIDSNRGRRGRVILSARRSILVSKERVGRPLPRAQKCGQRRLAPRRPPVADREWRQEIGVEFLTLIPVLHKRPCSR